MLKGEATWVLTNAITQSDPEQRAKFTQTFGGDLLNALCMRLRDLCEINHHELIFEVLNALEKLLELDREYPSEFEGDGRVGFLVDSFRGFDDIESLQEHPNEAIFEKARYIL